VGRDICQISKEHYSDPLFAAAGCSCTGRQVLLKLGILLVQQLVSLPTAFFWIFTEVFDVLMDSWDLRQTQ
jgi:hypothetical protein